MQGGVPFRGGWLFPVAESLRNYGSFIDEDISFGGGVGVIFLFFMLFPHGNHSLYVISVFLSSFLPQISLSDRVSSLQTANQIPWHSA
jgi:hypothetical protein